MSTTEANIEVLLNKSNHNEEQIDNIPVIIDEVKREVLETNIPILNLPVSDNQEMHEENESEGLSLTKHEFLYENQFCNQLDVNEMDVKTEEPDLELEPSGKIKLRFIL